MKILKKIWFIPALLIAFIALDVAAYRIFQPYMVNSGRFIHNDFELVCRDHPEDIWDKVFFGNSVVISGYREDLSTAGYINLAVDYGVVRDLWEMVDKGIIRVGSEIVIGINDLTLYDKFETNPSYLWHKDFYEPYAYFQRDKIRLYLESKLKEFLGGSSPDYTGQQKSFYCGSLSSQEIRDKVATSKYANLPIEDFQENMRCLQNLADYCAENGIRLRCVWMPINPEVEVSPETRAVYEQAKSICEANGLTFLDLERALPVECFYDIGHLNHEYGAYKFTEVIDPWLVK